MRYVIWCELVYGWVGEKDEKTDKYTLAVSPDHAKVFNSISEALKAMKELPAHWRSHMDVQEYTKGTQSFLQNPSTNPLKS